MSSFTVLRCIQTTDVQREGGILMSRVLWCTANKIWRREARVMLVKMSPVARGDTGDTADLWSMDEEQLRDQNTSNTNICCSMQSFLSVHTNNFTLPNQLHSLYWVCICTYGSFLTFPTLAACLDTPRSSILHVNWVSHINQSPT